MNQNEGCRIASPLTRRRFLTRSLAAGGALALPRFLPATALGRDGAVAPGERIVMGAIGIGGRGAGVLDWMLGEQEVRFVAVADVRKDRRDNAKQMVDTRYGNTDCAAYRDFRELLARPDIDAVLIATGDRWHAPASIMAMRAGKDVYCEKPSCLTLAQGRRLAETARRYGRIFQSGTQRLSEAPHVYAIEMARTGRLSPLHTV
jgi:predicted dehydrogenase